MIDYRIKSGKELYRPGENVTIYFGITNKTSMNMTILSFPPAFTIRKLRGNPAFVSKHSSEAFTLEPGRSQTYTLEWDQKVVPGPARSAEPGIYWVDSEPLRFESEGWYGGGHQGASYKGGFVIENAEGNMDKKLSPNQTVTENQIKITLQKIEISPLETKITIFVQPLDYVPPPPSPSLKDFYPYYTSGSYRLDSGKSIGLDTPAVGLQETGVRNSWSGIDPISRVIKNLTLVIDSVGGRKGPWIFEVRLQ